MRQMQQTQAECCFIGTVDHFLETTATNEKCNVFVVFSPIVLVFVCGLWYGKVSGFTWGTVVSSVAEFLPSLNI